MRSLRRDIASCLVLCAVTLGIALAWGSPFIVRTAHAEDGQPQQIQQQRAKAIQAIEKPHPGTVKHRHARLSPSF
jgi:hypothetical protein